MTTLAVFLAFWAKARWGDTWHLIRYVKGVRSVHSGLDIKAAAHTIVPALRPGKVVEVGKMTDVGWFIVVQVSKSSFDFYCHVLPIVAVGATVKRTTDLARVAGYDDEHGTMWLGPHLHFMVSTDANAIRKRALTIDPAPYVIAALAAVASGGGSSGSIPEEEDMPRIEFVKAKGDPIVWLSIDCLWRRPMKDMRDLTDTAALLGVQPEVHEYEWLTSFGAPVGVSAATDPAAIAAAVDQVLADDFAGLKALVAGIDAGTIDTRPILDALTSLPAAVRQELAAGLVSTAP